MQKLLKPLELRTPCREDKGIVLTDYLFFLLVLTAILKRYVGFRQGPEGGNVLFFVIVVLLIAY